MSLQKHLIKHANNCLTLLREGGLLDEDRAVEFSLEATLEELSRMIIQQEFGKHADSTSTITSFATQKLRDQLLARTNKTHCVTSKLVKWEILKVLKRENWTALSPAAAALARFVSHLNKQRDDHEKLSPVPPNNDCDRATMEDHVKQEVEKLEREIEDAGNNSKKLKELQDTGLLALDTVLHPVRYLREPTTTQHAPAQSHDEHRDLFTTIADRGTLEPEPDLPPWLRDFLLALLFADRRLPVYWLSQVRFNMRNFNIVENHNNLLGHGGLFDTLHQAILLISSSFVGDSHETIELVGHAEEELKKDRGHGDDRGQLSEIIVTGLLTATIRFDISSPNEEQRTPFEDSCEKFLHSVVLQSRQYVRYLRDNRKDRHLRREFSAEAVNTTFGRLGKRIGELGAGSEAMQAVQHFQVLLDETREQQVDREQFESSHENRVVPQRDLPFYKLVDDAVEDVLSQPIDPLRRDADGGGDHNNNEAFQQRRKAIRSFLSTERVTVPGTLRYFARAFQRHPDHRETFGDWDDAITQHQALCNLTIPDGGRIFCVEQLRDETAAEAWKQLEEIHDRCEFKGCRVTKKELRRTLINSFAKFTQARKALSESHAELTLSTFVDLQVRCIIEACVNDDVDRELRSLTRSLQRLWPAIEIPTQLSTFLVKNDGPTGKLIRLGLENPPTRDRTTIEDWVEFDILGRANSFRVKGPDDFDGKELGDLLFDASFGGDHRRPSLIAEFFRQLALFEFSTDGNRKVKLPVPDGIAGIAVRSLEGFLTVAEKEGGAELVTELQQALKSLQSVLREGRHDYAQEVRTDLSLGLSGPLADFWANLRTAYSFGSLSNYFDVQDQVHVSISAAKQGDTFSDTLDWWNSVLSEPPVDSLGLHDAITALFVDWQHSPTEFSGAEYETVETWAEDPDNYEIDEETTALRDMALTYSLLSQLTEQVRIAYQELP